MDINTLTKEEEEFFKNQIAEMNLHYLRATAGPPSDEYLMNINYNPMTGLPDKNTCSGCWREEEWCPEFGRLSLISLPEDNGTFSTFNPDFVPFGIQWPVEIQEKTEGECGEKRFSGLKSCGTWMEFTMDNEGRYVANGVVTELQKFNIIVKTEYGDCIVPPDLARQNKLKIGDEVKLLCRDNDVQEWATPIKCIKVIRSGHGACEEFAPCGWY